MTKRYTKFDFLLMFAPLVCFVACIGIFGYLQWPIVNEGEGYNFMQNDVRMGLAALMSVLTLYILIKIGSWLKWEMRQIPGAVIVVSCMLIPFVIKLCVLVGYSSFFRIHIDHESMRPVIQFCVYGYLALLMLYIYFKRKHSPPQQEF